MKSDLYFEEKTKDTLQHIIHSPENAQKITQLLKEYACIEKLQAYDLPVSNTLLFHGHTGCGKTMTAKALASKLNKKLISINLGGIVSSKLGDTARNITLLFKKALRENAVIFFDEFDSLGKIRDYDKDNGEMKRVVNAILQLMDYMPKDQVMIAATNQIEMIDSALIRRFDLQLAFSPPTKALLDHFYDKALKRYPEKYGMGFKKNYQISFAEAENLVVQHIKYHIINEME